MNSRDRLSGCELRQQIEESLEELLKQHEGLRVLKEQRRREEIESKLDDAKPLEDILQKLLQQSPALSNLFLRGLKAVTPFKTIGAQSQEQDFKGNKFPTYFKFKNKEYGTDLNRECHINMRCRVGFETNAENEYFSRSVDPGEFHLTLQLKDNEAAVQNYVMNLQNGVASLSLSLPEDVRVGQSLRYTAITNDCSRTEPFVNTFQLIAKEAQQPNGKKGTRTLPPGENEGDERERSSGIQLPKVRLVYEADWSNQNPTPFDKYTALRIINAGDGIDDENQVDSNTVYDFYINMDNLYLKTELKGTKFEPDLVRAQFKYGMVLIGLALLQQDIHDQRKESNKEAEEEGNNNDVNIEKRVESFCRAIAPVIIPMITSLGSLSLEEEAAIVASGEAT
jgi:hypothetical protein